jgi:hypothetical protein
MRKTLLSSFATAYKLKTLRNGAIVREWPRAYSLHVEDREAEGGYRILKNFTTDPSFEQIDEEFKLLEGKSNNGDTSNKKKPSAFVNLIREVAGFFKSMSRL